mgnify:CR=1 FL=1
MSTRTFTRNRRMELIKKNKIELIDSLYNRMINNKNFGEERCVFNKDNFGKEIGEELYKLGGVDYLFESIRTLTEDIMYKQSNSENISYYYTDLRELEFCWNNISNEFQA